MTKEEAIEHIRLMRLNAAISDAKSFREALDIAIDALSQPSLPSNLDEAAEFDKMFEDFCDQHPDGLTLNECAEFFYDKGKQAGAEWMAGQGETHEAEIIESVPFGGTTWKRCVRVWLDDQFSAKGNKVIVQIRNK